MSRKNTSILICVLTFSLVPLNVIVANASEGRDPGLWGRIRARYQSLVSDPEQEVEPEATVRPHPPRETRDVSPAGRRSREEMIRTIKARVEVFPIIINEIQGLSVIEDFSGDPVYVYSVTPGSVPVGLDRLDEEVLFNLFVMVNQRATMLDAERIQTILSQQDRIRAMQRAQEQAGRGAPAGSPSSAPGAVPRVPASAPAGVPRIPESPPATVPRIPASAPAGSPRVPASSPASVPRVPASAPASAPRVPATPGVRR